MVQKLGTFCNDFFMSICSASIGMRKNCTSEQKTPLKLDFGSSDLSSAKLWLNHRFIVPPYFGKSGLICIKNAKAYLATSTATTPATILQTILKISTHS